MIKRIYIVLLIGLLCFLNIHIARTQNATTETKVWIRCFTEIAGYENLLDYWSIRIEDGCYADLLSVTKEELGKYGFDLEVALNDEDAEKSVLFINSPLDIHGSPLVNLEDLTPPDLPVSNILAVHATDEIVVYGGTSQNRQDTGYFVTAIILYSLDHCDEAFPYFNKVEGSSIGRDEFMSGSGSFNPPLLDYIAFYRGNCSLISGDYQQAIDNFNSFTSLDLFYGTVNAPTNLAWAYLQLDKPEEAFGVMNDMVKSLQSGWNAYPSKQARAYKSRAQLYALVEQYPDAITDLTAALELDPTNPEIYSLRGQMYRALYEWDSALADFNAALELDPTYAEAYYQRGLLYASILQTGAEFYDEALADFQHYLELAPEGEHAAEAAQYITDLQSQQQSLNE